MRLVNENGGVQLPAGFLLRVCMRGEWPIVAIHIPRRELHNNIAATLTACWLVACRHTQEKQCRFTPCCGMLATADVYRIGHTAGVPAHGVHGKDHDPLTLLVWTIILSPDHILILL